MPRRPPYSRVKKHDQKRPKNVRGQGDEVYKHFQCLGPGCEAWFTVSRADTRDGFQLRCGACQHELKDGHTTTVYHYDLVVNGDVVAEGPFEVDHGQYVREALEYKYCIVCYAMKPLEAFGRHKRRKASGRQGECTSCKTTYNGIKNGTRIPDQHREASQRRRILGLLSGTARIDRDAILEAFDHKCFNCDVAITKDNEELDHTLPVRLLWPLTTENATLLCKPCNGQKSARWPSEFYDDSRLRRLVLMTSIPYEILSGRPIVNQEAVELIEKDPDAFLAEWIHDPDELRLLSKMVKEIAGIDIFKNATNVPSFLFDEP